MKNRWAVALAGTVAMICLGTVYSWSVFTQPLIASFGWSNTTTTWTFAVAIFFLGVGAIIGGRWQDRAGPRPPAVTGLILWGVGNILAGIGTHALGAWWIYLTYGVIGGIGLGLGYITPVAAVTKWFPDKRGVGSGMVVMGFGLGAFFYSNILKAVPAFTAASREAGRVATARASAIAHGTPFDMATMGMRPESVSAIMTTFIVSGVIFAIVGGLCAAYVTNPPAGYTMPGATAAAAAQGPNRTPAEAARTWQFYALWLMLFLNVTAGILFISNAVPIMRELTGAAPATALGIYGLIAIFNGLGRFFWGAVSDRIGRNWAYILIYGWILLAWGVGGIVGPIFTALVKDITGSFAGSLVPIAVMLIVAMILPIVTRRPSQARVEPPRRPSTRRDEVETGPTMNP